MGIYFDHNATTRVNSEVVDTMTAHLSEDFGNPSSIHALGQQAARGMDLAREQIANLIGSQPEELIFTSGGTESNNHAIFGVLGAIKGAGRLEKECHIVTSAIEHHAVLAPCQTLQERGYKVTYVGVDTKGAINPDEAAAAITDQTVLVSVMAANNDVGTIQPIREIASAARDRGITVHCDAVQAVGKIAMNVSDLGVDLMSISSHKLYGPKGVGALYIRPHTKIVPLIYGGHQEQRRRGGTQNVPAIAGFGKACELAAKHLDESAAHVTNLKMRLQRGIEKEIDNVEFNGDFEHGLPGTLNMSVDKVDGEVLVMALDLLGVAVSTGSACTSDSREISHVLTAMGRSKEQSLSSVRFSLGRENTDREVDEVIRILSERILHLRVADDLTVEL